MKETLPLDQNGHLFGKGVDEVDVFRFEDHTFIDDNHCAHHCAWCGTQKDFQVTESKVWQRWPCPYPSGITTKTYLNVPSGKIVVYDDLRELYPLPDREFASYNSVLGQAQVVGAYAAVGLAYGPVGNSSPDLFCTGDGTYVIAATEYDEDTDDRAVPDGWVKLATVTTDLWAYSIADHDDFMARGGTLNNGRIYGPDVVGVPPGTYCFTHHTGEKGFDHYAPGTVIFAHIERVKETN